MSLRDGYAIKELQAEVAKLRDRVAALEQNIIEGDVSRETQPEDLIQKYMDRYGKPPHHRMKPETIKEALR